MYTVDTQSQWTGICTGMNLTSVQAQKTEEYAEDSEQSMQNSYMTAADTQLQWIGEYAQEWKCGFDRCTCTGAQSCSKTRYAGQLHDSSRKVKSTASQGLE